MSAPAPRTGGTIEQPGRLYPPPGTGECPACGLQDAPTCAGRVAWHGVTRQAPAYGPDAFRVKTCPGWGRQAVQP